MNESSLAADLLATARDLLRAEVAPALPARLRFPAASMGQSAAGVTIGISRSITTSSWAMRQVKA